jgi:hypothetical protein
MCKSAIGFYLNEVIGALPTSKKPRMYSMCEVLFAFGPTVIVCVRQQFPVVAFTVFGQMVRCGLAKELLGLQWGSEKAEETVFIDRITNKTLNATDFILDGFGLFLYSSTRHVDENI